MKINQNQKVNDNNLNQKNSFTPIKTGDNTFEENLKDLGAVNDLNKIVGAENLDKTEAKTNIDSSVKIEDVQLNESVSKTNALDEKEVKSQILDKSNMISVVKETKNVPNNKKSEISELEQTLQEFVKPEAKTEHLQPKAEEKEFVKPEIKAEQLQPKAEVEEFVKPEIKAEQLQPKAEVEEFVKPEIKAEQLQPKAEVEEFVKPEIKAEQLQPKAEEKEFVKPEIKAEQLQPKAEVEEFVKPEIKAEQLQPKAEVEEFVKPEIKAEQHLPKAEVKEFVKPEIKAEQLQPKAEVEEFVKPEIKAEQLQPKAEVEELVKSEIKMKQFQPKAEVEVSLNEAVKIPEKDENVSIFTSLPLLNQLLNIDNDLNIQTPKMEDIIPVSMRESAKNDTKILNEKPNILNELSLNKNKKEIALNVQSDYLDNKVEQPNIQEEKIGDISLIKPMVIENFKKEEQLKKELISEEANTVAENSFAKEHIAINPEKDQSEKLNEINEFLNEIMAEDTVESLKTQDVSMINNNVLLNEEIKNYYNLNKAENYAITEDIKNVINDRISTINEISEMIETSQEAKAMQQELKTLDTPKAEEKKVETKQLTLTEKDAKFFSELVKTSQETGQTVTETVNKVLEDVQKPQETEQTATVSKALADMINEAAKTNKPFRIDFDKNISVIIKVDREGRISAEFIPGDKAVEQYLKSQLPLLQQKFDKEQIDYKDLNYRQSNGGKQQRERRKRGE